MPWGGGLVPEVLDRGAVLRGRKGPATGGRPAESGLCQLFHALAVLLQQRIQELARTREVQAVADRSKDLGLDFGPPAAEIVRVEALPETKDFRDLRVVVGKPPDRRGEFYELVRGHGARDGLPPAPLHRRHDVVCQIVLHLPPGTNATLPNTPSPPIGLLCRLYGAPNNPS